MDETDDEDEGTPSTKVGRLLDSYDFDPGYGAELEARWTGERGERTSLRDLADAFNTRLLELALRSAGASVIDGEVDNLYRLLTDEEASAGGRVEARGRLEREGVDVDQLESDFVTYQAIRSYLKDVRGAEHQSTSGEKRVENTTETVERLLSRVQSVVASDLAGLRRADRITLGDFHLFVEVNVLCRDCQAQYGVVELLRRGGCDCETTAPDQPEE